MSKDNQAFNLIVEALAIDGTQYIVWDGRDNFLFSDEKTNINLQKSLPNFKINMNLKEFSNLLQKENLFSKKSSQKLLEDFKISKKMAQ